MFDDLGETARRALIAIVVIALLAAASWWYMRPVDCRLQVAVRMQDATASADVIDVVRENGFTHSQIVTASGRALLVLPRMARGERWSFSLRIGGSASKSIELNGCPATPVTFEGEEANVDLAPQ
jgi:hypothetical protein